MPTYVYDCNLCGSIEIVQKINDTVLHTCPKCSSTNFMRCVTMPAYGKTSKTIKTFGQQAELNAKRLGKDGMARKELEYQQKKSEAREAMRSQVEKIGGKMSDDKYEVPWWRDGSMGLEPMAEPLDTSKIQNVDKYIVSGETT